MKLIELITKHTTENRQALLLGLVAENFEKFKAAPASGALRRHHAYEGGLMDHICEVAELSIALAGAIEPAYGPGPTAQEIVTVAVLHDLNKIGDAGGNAHYIPNISEKTGKRSVAEPFVKNKDAHKPFTSEPEIGAIIQYADLSCGELSLATLAGLSTTLLEDLTDTEINAIRFHDGGYGKAKYAAGYQGKEDRLAILIHTSDMLSSRKRNWEVDTVAAEE